MKGGRALRTRQQEKMIRFLRDKYSQGDYLGHEIIIAIVDLVSRSQIDQSDARGYLEEIFCGDITAIYRSAKMARGILEPGVVEKILA